MKDYNFNVLSRDESGGELLEMRLLDSHLLDTFGSKSIARHEIESSYWLNRIRAVEQMTLSHATYKLKKSIFFL